MHGIGLDRSQPLSPAFGRSVDIREARAIDDEHACHALGLAIAAGLRQDSFGAIAWAMSDSKPACGPHEEIVRTEAVRITRCACGTIHLTLQRSGVTVQLASEQFGEVVQALTLARTILEPREQSNSRAQATPALGRFVTIESPGMKKPSN